MGKRQLAVILAFALLLAAGLNYTGRNMHQVLGGDKKFYAFLLPDLDGGRVVFCGRAYAQYQAANLWDRQAAALEELWQAVHLVSSQQAGAEKALRAIRDRWQSLRLCLEALLIKLRSLIASLPEALPEVLPRGR